MCGWFLVFNPTSSLSSSSSYGTVGSSSTRVDSNEPTTVFANNPVMSTYYSRPTTLSTWKLAETQNIAKGLLE